MDQTFPKSLKVKVVSSNLTWPVLLFRKKEGRFANPSGWLAKNCSFGGNVVGLMKLGAFRRRPGGSAIRKAQLKKTYTQ